MDGRRHLSGPGTTDAVTLTVLGVAGGAMTFSICVREPYRRVFVLHVTVVSGAFGVALVGSPVGALVVMVVVKTLLDLRGHWQEHDRARQRTLDPSPAA